MPLVIKNPSIVTAASTGGFNLLAAERVKFLTRQSFGKVRAFFIKHQDRLMYGTDLTIENWGSQSEPRTPEEDAKLKDSLRKRYRADWDYDGFLTQGLNLPTEVLEKFYYKNAQRTILGL